jgi:hypothetical protein
MEWRKEIPTRVSKSRRRLEANSVRVPKVEAQSSSSLSPCRSPGAAFTKMDAKLHTSSVLGVLYMVGKIGSRRFQWHQSQS